MFSFSRFSASFDTIDHDNVFYILERYVGIGGSTLRLIRAYFFVIVHKEFRLMVLFINLIVWGFTWLSSETNEICFLCGYTW